MDSKKSVFIHHSRMQHPVFADDYVIPVFLGLNEEPVHNQNAKKP
jgi:hypothetical protein